MVTTQYRHVARILEPAPTTEDSNGDPVAGEVLLKYETVCRYEVSTRSQYNRGDNGNKEGYKGIVYMPLPVELSSEYVPGPVPDASFILAGATGVYVATQADEDAGNIVNIPALAGKSFTLKMDGYPLTPDEYNILISGGFSLNGLLTVIKGTRYEYTIYYVMNQSGGSVGGSFGGDFWIKPGAIVEVYEGSRMIMSERVSQFMKGMLNMRIWLALE